MKFKIHSIMKLLGQPGSRREMWEEDIEIIDIGDPVQNVKLNVCFYGRVAVTLLSVDS